ncbi:TonB C-terminal domain-containing protein [bacterium]
MIRKYIQFQYSVYLSLFFHIIGMVMLCVFLTNKKERVYMDVPVELIKLQTLPKQVEGKSIEKAEKKREPVLKAEPLKQKAEQVKQIPKQKTVTLEKIKEVSKDEPECSITRPRQRTRSRITTQGAKTTFTPKFEGETFAYPYYLRIIRAKISKQWEVPHDVVVSIGAVVYFRIDKKGKIIMYNIYKKSGNDSFDHAALRAVVLSGPYPALPADYKENYLGVYFGFEFNN